MKTANIRFSTYIYQFHEINIFKDCDAKQYGKACSESCGACLHSTICNHITGDCGLGCEPGWQKTATCKTGNYLIVTSSFTSYLSNYYCKCMNFLNNISKQKRQFMIDIWYLSNEIITPMLSKCNSFWTKKYVF